MKAPTLEDGRSTRTWLLLIAASLSLSMHAALAYAAVHIPQPEPRKPVWLEMTVVEPEPVPVTACLPDRRGEDTGTAGNDGQRRRHRRRVPSLAAEHCRTGNTRRQTTPSLPDGSCPRDLRF